MIDLNGNIVVVTGGCGTIGRSFVQSIIKHNGVAIIADKDVKKGEEQRAVLVEEFGDQVVDFIQLDITSKPSIVNLIETLSRKYGRIDAWINNAYPRNEHYGRSFFEVEYKDFSENVSMHVGGYFLCSQQIAQYFKMQGHGNIINMASIYGMIAPRFEIYADTAMTMPVEYAAIKSAVILLTQYMAKYFKGLNIRVNAISPGGILDQQPESFLKHYQEFCLTKGMLDKEDLEGTMLFLLSSLSSFINGQNLPVDDGFSL